MKKLLLTIAMLVSLFANATNAEENKVTTWLQTEWNDIVEFQKVNWQEGKEQLANNKLQIQTLFQKVRNYVSQN
jgi:hypothetical protein